MSYVLNNQASVDTYTAPCSLACRGGVKAGVTVANASVFMRPTFRDVDGSTTVGAEVFVLPGFFSYSRPVDKLEFRSGATGVPAKVTAEVLLQSET